MAVTDIEINATAAQLEEAALAEKWDKLKIVNAIYPVGSIVFYFTQLDASQLDIIFGTTSAWESWLTLEDEYGNTVYGYRRRKL